MVETGGSSQKKGFMSPTLLASTGRFKRRPFSPPTLSSSTSLDNGDSMSISSRRSQQERCKSPREDAEFFNMMGGANAVILSSKSTGMESTSSSKARSRPTTPAPKSRPTSPVVKDLLNPSLTANSRCSSPATQGEIVSKTSYSRPDPETINTSNVSAKVTSERPSPPGKSMSEEFHDIPQVTTVGSTSSFDLRPDSPPPEEYTAMMKQARARIDASVRSAKSIEAASSYDNQSLSKTSKSYDEYAIKKKNSFTVGRPSSRLSSPLGSRPTSPLLQNPSMVSQNSGRVSLLKQTESAFAQRTILKDSTFKSESSGGIKGIPRNISWHDSILTGVSPTSVANESNIKDVNMLNFVSQTKYHLEVIMLGAEVAMKEANSEMDRYESIRKVKTMVAQALEHLGVPIPEPIEEDIARRLNTLQNQHVDVAVGDVSASVEDFFETAKQHLELILIGARVIACPFTDVTAEIEAEEARKAEEEALHERLLAEQMMLLSEEEEAKAVAQRHLLTNGEDDGIIADDVASISSEEWNKNYGPDFGEFISGTWLSDTPLAEGCTAGGVKQALRSITDAVKELSTKEDSLEERLENDTGKWDLEENKSDFFDNLCDSTINHEIANYDMIKDDRVDVDTARSNCDYSVPVTAVVDSPAVMDDDMPADEAAAATAELVDAIAPVDAEMEDVSLTDVVMSADKVPEDTVADPESAQLGVDSPIARTASCDIPDNFDSKCAPQESSKKDESNEEMVGQVLDKVNKAIERMEDIQRREEPVLSIGLSGDILLEAKTEDEVMQQLTPLTRVDVFDEAGTMASMSLAPSASICSSKIDCSRVGSIEEQEEQDNEDNAASIEDTPSNSIPDVQSGPSDEFSIDHAKSMSFATAAIKDSPTDMSVMVSEVDIDHTKTEEVKIEESTTDTTAIVVNTVVETKEVHAVTVTSEPNESETWAPKSEDKSQDVFSTEAFMSVDSFEPSLSPPVITTATRATNDPAPSLETLYESASEDLPASTRSHNVRDFDIITQLRAAQSNLSFDCNDDDDDVVVTETNAAPAGDNQEAVDYATARSVKFSFYETNLDLDALSDKTNDVAAPADSATTTTVAEEKCNEQPIAEESSQEEDATMASTSFDPQLLTVVSSSEDGVDEVLTHREQYDALDRYVVMDTIAEEGSTSKDEFDIESKCEELSVTKCPSLSEVKPEEAGPMTQKILQDFPDNTTTEETKMKKSGANEPEARIADVIEVEKEVDTDMTTIPVADSLDFATKEDLDALSRSYSNANMHSISDNDEGLKSRASMNHYIGDKSFETLHNNEVDAPSPYQDYFEDSAWENDLVKKTHHTGVVMYSTRKQVEEEHIRRAREAAEAEEAAAAAADCSFSGITENATYHFGLVALGFRLSFAQVLSSVNAL